MALTRATSSYRFAIALAVVILVALALLPAAARAGTYDVVACDAAPGGGWGSWSGVASPAMSWGVDCPTQRSATRGMWVRNSVNSGRVQPFASSTMSFEAPQGASLVFFSGQYALHRDDAYWKVGLFADGAMMTGCPANQSNTLCNFSTAWPGITGNWGWSAGVHKINTEVACGSAVWCSTDAQPAPFSERAAVRLFSALVRVRDETAPAVSRVDGGLIGGTWLRGSHFIGYGASDNVGIRATRLYVDSARSDDLDRDCDFTQRVPCSNLPYARYTVDTQGLSDGTHEVRVEAVDTAANAASLVRTIQVDNHAPAVPDAVAVEGGESWRQTNSFKLGWSSPPSAAPITVAHYELCNTASGTCTLGERRGDGIAGISDLAVPEPGDYTVRVWLEDAAGNVTAENKSVPVHVRFDDVAPGEASPRKQNGWIGALEAQDLTQAIDMSPGELVPVSGIAGYSVTTDGSDPDALIDVRGETYRTGDLAEGTTVFKARAISGSGISSAKVGMTLIKIDKSPPTASVDRVSDSGWHRTAAQLHLTGTDQTGLSGMAPAEPDQPIEKGAYVSHRLDAGQMERARGGESDLILSADGEHVITYSATDVAGNESPQGTARVRIDRTPPNLVVFEAPGSDDPRRVEVAAADQTSGIAGGKIEYRGLSTGTGRWTELRTVRAGNRFVASIDDEVLPRGVYQLRARVTDLAGNEATGDRRRDGSVASFNTATLRSGTTLAAGLVKPTVKRRCTRRRGRKKHCKTTTSAASGTLVKTLAVPFGKAATGRGTLTTVDGAPIAGAAVDVYVKSASAGSAFKTADHLRTDAAGGFAYTAQPGESRILRFAYAGSAHMRSTRAEVALKVPAASTIRANRRAARNGERVRFTGRLRSKPIPASGKLIDLQAFYRGRWRTFATPRAARNGAWRYAYRFGATRGTVRYRFRVVIRAESAYPFDLGYSKAVRVRVTGR